MPSRGDAAFAEFCAAGLWPGLGATLAATLAESGCSAEHVSVARLQQLPGVGATRAGRLYSAWVAAADVYEVVRLLCTAGLPARWASRICDQLGTDVPGALRDDPWLLLAHTDCSVAEADSFARAIDRGVRRDDPRRGRALVGYLLARQARSGHTALPRTEVQSELVAESVADTGAAISSACRRDVVEFDADGISALALARYADAERVIAEAIGTLSKAAERFDTDGESDAELDDLQRHAVREAMTHGVSVLTGGPGTGKSRTVAALVRLADRAGKTVALAAPTGRAAKRLAELVGADASTLHRLLSAQGGRTGSGQTQFARGPGWPLDADLVVVDEASMIDVELGCALLRAVTEGTHLLLVGDPAQLPSIGPGQLLADLIASGSVPVTELVTLYRQADGGAIARLATAVRGGTLPARLPAGREVVVVPAGGSGEAAHRVTQLVTDSIPRALGIAADSVQVVTPIHRGPAGTAALNAALKARLNPGRGTVRGFDVGDRVVATANHLDAEPAGYANGEIGVVTTARDASLIVAFATGPATVRGRALGDLVHGWAITVHRAQGSEWPAVVVVLPAESSRMLSRPLVYTALTRARSHLSIVHAAGGALPYAVRTIGAQPRRTRLAQLLRVGEQASVRA